MQKIKIRLPTTLTNFGPSLDSLGLAVGLYTYVELSPRSYNQLIVETLDKAFQNLNIKAHVLPVPVDTQGVVISIMQSA